MDTWNFVGTVHQRELVELLMASVSEMAEIDEPTLYGLLQARCLGGSRCEGPYSIHLNMTQWDRIYLERKTQLTNMEIMLYLRGFVAGCEAAACKLS